MRSIASAHGSEATLLEAARAGDLGAFDALVTDHRRALHLHCYRMLGSYHDAEEATQETMLRAWRRLDLFEGRAPLRHWLYRIATTTCLNMITARNRVPAGLSDVPYLTPYPDQLLDQLPSVDADPAAVAERRESVALAFVAALQSLPATQRATLILRDVLGWPAAEVAELLDTTVAAVNSSLQRARATLPSPGGRRSLDERDREVAERFMTCWHRCDFEALAALLREDAILRMPPERAEFRGRTAIIDFFATVPADGHLDHIRLQLTRANGGPAVAAWMRDETGEPSPFGLMALTVDDGRIATITGFPDPALFAVFGLPG
ncbi:RNA polymerase subunit sigma-70 [Kribbella caucasensis]|uniref:RNA polymerase subunit sigma-70 n=1 Tax=Kribbella caucasensis TaxID=2512215 RepID=UPI00192D7DAB|nr:RNA polymerase subunit sigma-70 [Kribbella sp. VKM Ac-2527]